MAARLTVGEGWSGSSQPTVSVPARGPGAPGVVAIPIVAALPAGTSALPVSGENPALAAKVQFSSSAGGTAGFETERSAVAPTITVPKSRLEATPIFAGTWNTIRIGRWSLAFQRAFA